MSQPAELREPQGPRHRSLSDFYRADPQRIDSREVDVGLWWREGTSGALHRAAWIVDTGELYSVRLGPVEEGGGQVDVLAVVAERDQLEHVLDGWRDECGAPDSFAWLRERAGRARERGRRARLRLAAAAVPQAVVVATTVAGELV